jgi:O-antigen/teichoic acid export membrane protein
LLAFAGQALVYALSLLLARRLGVDGFDDYAVASAVFMLLVGIACLGSEKYALRLLPVLLERGDWGRVRGYLRFGLQRGLRTATWMCVGVVLIAVAFGDRLQPSTRNTIIVAALALPLGAAVHFGLEALTASGREFAASAIFRIVVPASALVCVLALFAWRGDLSGMLAVACWGPGWLLALVLMAAAGRRGLPPPVLQAVPVIETDLWRAESRPFFYYRLSLGLLGHSGLIALTLLKAPPAEVGSFAAAAATAGLASVLASSTNRAYGRRLSLLLERQDYSGVLGLRRRRLRWLLPCVALFLLGSLFFGRELMMLFRPEFAESGTPALWLLAAGVSLAVLLALAPTYLKYRRRKRATYTIVACAALLQTVGLWWLVPRFGATGAAAAYLLSIVAMYGSFAWLAHRELSVLRASQCVPPIEPKESAMPR